MRGGHSPLDIVLYVSEGREGKGREGEGREGRRGEGREGGEWIEGRGGRGGRRGEGRGGEGRRVEGDGGEGREGIPFFGNSYYIHECKTTN